MLLWWYSYYCWGIVLFAFFLKWTLLWVALKLTGEDYSYEPQFLQQSSELRVIICINRKKNCSSWCCVPSKALWAPTPLKHISRRVTQNGLQPFFMLLVLFKSRMWLLRIWLVYEGIWGLGQRSPTSCLGHRQFWPAALVLKETRKSCLSCKCQQGCWRLPPALGQMPHRGWRLRTGVEARKQHRQPHGTWVAAAGLAKAQESAGGGKGCSYNMKWRSGLIYWATRHSSCQPLNWH